MKLSCIQENLAKGLGIVSHLSSNRATLPVLSNILLKAEKGRLNLSATDLEIGISSWIGAKVEKDGAITCPARLLSEFTSANSDKTINLELKETVLHLSSEHFKANIKGIEASEFPIIPEVKNGLKITLPAMELKDSILKTAFASALDETRPVLAGINFKSAEAKLKMASTDSYRLAEKTVNLESAPKESINVIVPGRSLMEVGRLIDEEAEKAEIIFGENQVQFNLGSKVLISRLVEGSFPDYEQIIPANIKTKILLNLTEFQSAIKMASFFARDTANNIKLQFKKTGQLNVIASSPQVGENISEMKGEFTGEELEIAFNAKFILDVLPTLNTEKIHLELAGPLSPAILRPEKDKNYFYIMMPLRMDE